LVYALAFPAGARGPLVRDRSAVEHGLPWVMDMVFHDAECRLRKEHAPAKDPCVSSVKPQMGRRLPRKPSLTRFPWRRKTGELCLYLFLSHGVAHRTCPRRLGSNIQDGCEIRPGGPNRCWEVGGGRTTRQPGQVRKEAALTRPGGSLSSLPLCSPYHHLALSGRPAGPLDIGPDAIKSLA
jgi:hypothetical protein